MPLLPARTAAMEEIRYGVPIWLLLRVAEEEPVRLAVILRIKNMGVPEETDQLLP